MANSRRWLDRHLKDPYVKQAQTDGYVSRAAYKLLELNQKDQLLKPGMQVLDLGAAPGGWLQVAKQLVGEQGRVIGVDLLPLQEISGVEFIQGDFTDERIFEQILVRVQDGSLDAVISDMAPNISGIKSVDQPRSVYLVELAIDCAKQLLAPDGVFVAKLFQGEGSDQLVQTLRADFKVVKFRKPKASRSSSSEVYVVAKGLRI